MIVFVYSGERPMGEIAGGFGEFLVGFWMGIDAGLWGFEVKEEKC